MKFDEFVWNAHLVVKELPLPELGWGTLVACFGYALYRAMKEEV